MKSKPMLFNAEMVNALLDGRKTQTRRILSPQPEMGIQRAVCGYLNGNGNLLICKHGSVGDLIYVRETFKITENAFNDIEGQYCINYSADDGCRLINPDFDNNDKLAHAVLKKGCTPSIHMPRWASRLTLKITSVRAEQLQSISEEDAKAEGVIGEAEAIEAGISWYDKPRKSFEWLWRKTYSEESWSANPWVWVIEFKVIKANVDVVLKELKA